MLWRGITAAFFLSVVMPAFASQNIDQATKEYLTGNWAVLTVDRKVGNACVDSQPASDSWEEYEITFDGTGGDLYVLDEIDSDFRLRILRAVKIKNTIELTLSNPSKSKIVFEPIDSGKMRVLSAWGPDTGAATLFAFRCPRHHLPSKPFH